MKKIITSLLLLLGLAPAFAQGVLDIYTPSNGGHTSAIGFVMDGELPNNGGFYGRAVLMEVAPNHGTAITIRELGGMQFQRNGRPTVASLNTAFTNFIPSARRGNATATWMEMSQATAKEVIEGAYKIRSNNQFYNKVPPGDYGNNSSHFVLDVYGRTSYTRMADPGYLQFIPNYNALRHQHFINRVMARFDPNKNWSGLTPVYRMRWSPASTFAISDVAGYMRKGAFRIVNDEFDNILGISVLTPLDYAVLSFGYGSIPPRNGKTKGLELDGKAGDPISLNLNDFFPENNFTNAAQYEVFSGNTRLSVFNTQSLNNALSTTLDVSKINFLGRDGQIRFIQLPNFGGVDFTNLKVSGLDINYATGMVNLVTKGETGNGSGPSLSQQEADLKKLFLQALTVPTAEWYVSLDNNPAPLARATSSFKQTDMADAFFKADVDLKRDMFAWFYNGADGQPNVMQKWMEILAHTNPAMLLSLVQRNVEVMPAVNIRGIIVPELANNLRDGGKALLEDARYRIDIADTTITINFNLPGWLTPAEVYFLTGPNLDLFKTWLQARSVAVAPQIAARVNAGITPAYKKMVDILPTLVLAKWYKEAQLPVKQFDYLIDRRLTGNSAPGLNLTQNISFNQGFWNGQANQVLGNTGFNVSAGGYSFSGAATISGGIDLFKARLANNQLLTGQRNLLQAAKQTNFINQGGKNYINSGGINANLPNLAVDNISVFSAHRDDMPYGVVYSTPTDSIELLVDLQNLGQKKLLKNSSHLSIQISNLITGAQAGFFLTSLDSLNPMSFEYYRYTIPPKAPGRYRAVVRIDPLNTQTELSEADNVIVKEFLVADTCNGTALNIGTVNATPGTLYSACTVTMNGTVSSSGQVTAQATNEVVWNPGFEFEASEGNGLLAKGVFSLATGQANPNGRSENAGVNPETDALREKEERIYFDRSANQSVYRIMPEAGKYTDPGEEGIPEEIKQERKLRSLKGSIQVNIRYLKDAKEAPVPECWKAGPNPMKDQLQVQFNLQKPETVTLELFAMNGAKAAARLMSGVKLNAGMSNKTITIPAGLPAGTYLLRLTTASGINSSKVMIKQ